MGPVERVHTARERRRLDLQHTPGDRHHVVPHHCAQPSWLSSLIKVGLRLTLLGGGLKTRHLPTPQNRLSVFLQPSALSPASSRQGMLYGDRRSASTSAERRADAVTRG